MKAFFEEYGFVLVSIVVVMMLVAIVPIVGGSVSDQLKELTEKLEEKVNIDNLDLDGSNSNGGIS